MDDEARHRAFEQFFRSADARRLAPDGSGVGLYAARGLVRAMGGEMTLDSRLGFGTTVGIERLHLEQDAGKSLHDQHPAMSFVDLNRSGVALMEIVSRPDMRSPAEAGAYVRKLRSILRYVGSCDGNMEEGSMRADVNVSVRRPGEEFGTRSLHDVVSGERDQIMNQVRDKVDQDLKRIGVEIIGPRSSEETRRIVDRLVTLAAE